MPTFKVSRRLFLFLNSPLKAQMNKMKQVATYLALHTFLSPVEIKASPEHSPSEKSTRPLTVLSQSGKDGFLWHQLENLQIDPKELLK